MLIDIQSMFKDIIETPQQRRAAMQQEGEQQAQTAVGTLSGAGKWVAPLIAQMARQQPERSAAMQRGMGGMLNAIPGIERETRTPSEQLQGALAGADNSTAAGLEKTAQQVEDLGYSVQAAEIRQKVKEKQDAEVKAQNSQESLLMMVRDSELPPQQKGMLMRSINADPSQDPDKLVNTILKMGGELPPAAQLLKYRALQMGLVEGSPEWKAFMARDGREEGTGGKAPTARDERINNLIPQFTAQGFSPEEAATEAANIADGNVKYDTTPNGEVIRTDVVAGTATPVESGFVPEEVPKPRPGKTVWELAEQGTGPISALKAGIARTPGVSQFAAAMGLNTAEAVEARSQIKNIMSEAIRGLAVNDKFPVGEIKRITESIDLEPSAFDSVPSYRSRLKAQDTYLETRQAQANRDAADRSLPAILRAQQRGNASTIANLRSYLGVPGAEGGTQGEAEIMEMSDEELGDVNISELTDEALAAYIKRLEG